ncbi:TPA: hypothetical protein ACH3X3_000699 [Trebouxia sp. C0006]
MQGRGSDHNWSSASSYNPSAAPDVDIRADSQAAPSTTASHAAQPTDEWAFFSRIGFKGPVTKAELCRCFQTGELQGDVFIHHCSEDSTSGKELKDWYEQWGPHMPAVRRPWREGGPTLSIHQRYRLLPSTITKQQLVMYGWKMRPYQPQSIADGGFDDLRVTVI